MCLLGCTQKTGPCAMVDTHKSRSVIKFYSLDSQRNLAMVDTHKSRSVVKFYSLDSQRNLCLPGILKNSSRVELECGTTPAGRHKSSSSRREVFDGPLSGQSVYEQTSGVLRHTESVRGDKVLEQD